jgi:phosphoribosylglycinamide formyltransferase 1
MRKKVTGMRKRVAVLISGRGSNLAALIAATRDPTYPAEIALVISNRADAIGLRRPKEAGIATMVVDHATHVDRQAFERALHGALEENHIAFVCLAGFMRLLTPWFVTQWQGRMLNIHPALLPAFKGLDTHTRALAAGVKVHGATVHFVVPEVDSGPIIAQGAVSVFDTDTAETLAARVLAVEHQIYPRALRWLVEDRIEIIAGRCRIAGTRASDAPLIVPDASFEPERVSKSMRGSP